MLFSSVTFVYLFLPILLGVYLALLLPVQRLGPTRSGMSLVNATLLALSLALYAWSESVYVLVVLASTTIDYTCGAWLGRRDVRTALDKWILALSISSNLGLLAFFKYLDFGRASAQQALGAVGFGGVLDGAHLELALPLGISFYTFQSMSYTIDVYRGHVRPTGRFVDFACYVTMFPQLVAGPIVRYTDIAQQLVSRRVDLPLFASGAQRVVYGLAKKVLIADTLAIPADQIFEIGRMGDMPSPSVAWLGLLCYTLQIYFDFSGYSDMAIGLGRMLGFRFLENFRHPYVAQSITEFWRRWHISLSTWFRDYLYIPLGGNRVSPWRTYRNLAIVFLLCGLWHGASWTFVVWGALHGSLLVVERLGLGAFLERLWRPMRHAYTLLALMLTWVVFRCETLAHAGSYALALVGRAPQQTWHQNLHVLLEIEVALALIAGVILSTPVARWAAHLRVRSVRRASAASAGGLRLVWAVGSVLFFAAVMLLAAIQVAATTHQPFIYFRF